MSHRQGGFTIIEVLVALGLFAIIMASLPGVLVATTRANLYAKHITAATNVAQDKIEAIRNAPYGSVTSGSDQVTNGPVTYARNWSVSTGPTSTTKNITVTVGWMDQTSHQVALTGLITE